MPPTTEETRPPGRPRENPTPAMLTIRCNPAIYESMMGEVELARQGDKKYSQRAFIEEALRREVARRERNRARRRG